MRTAPFQRFFDTHRDDVYRFLVGMVGPVDADDCFQETFLSALRAYGSLKDASNLRGWVLTIAQRKALDEHRSRARRPSPTGALPEKGAEPASAPDTALWEAVRALPPKQRAAIVYRFANDLPYEQIGALVECSTDAARRSVHEGLKKLREAYRA